MKYLRIKSKEQEEKLKALIDITDVDYVRNHGHLNGVYSLSIHPTLDLLMSGSRDCTCRVWDMRTKG